MKTNIGRRMVVLTVMCYAALPCRGIAVTVTSLADSGPGTLRQAIASSVAGSTIDFAVNGTITLTSGELAIGRDLTIIGPGTDNLIVNGNHASRVFNILSGVIVSISSLTISNGYVQGTGSPSGQPGLGGGVLNDGALTLSQCVIVGNQAWGSFGEYESGYDGGDGCGGGICNSGSINISECLITNNRAHGGPAIQSDREGGAGMGGGVYNSGFFRISDCQIVDNTAHGSEGGQNFKIGQPAFGGGIYNQCYDLADGIIMSQCTLARNAAYGCPCDEGGDAYGGALYDAGYGLFIVVNCTIAENRASGGFGLGTYPANITTGGSASGGAFYGHTINERLYFQSCTIASNLADGGTARADGGAAYGGGLSIGSHNALKTFVNNLISGNRAKAGLGSPDGSATGPDIHLLSGSFLSASNNLVGITNGASLAGYQNIFGNAASPFDPLLGPLQDNGGDTPTMLPGVGSAAIDNGNRFGLTIDQRGFTRPQDLPGYPNAADGSDIGAVEVRPSDLCTAPTITTQPANQTVTLGEYAMFSVKAAGSEPLIYQWCFDGAPLPGATGTNYTVANARLSDEGGYSVVVTNSCGSATSTVATLTVQPLDIGLRVFDGTNTVHIACETPGAGGQFTSPLRIHKNGTNYGVLLVDPDAGEASMLKIQTIDGIKALRKLE